MQPLPSGQPSCHLCHARDASCPLSSFLDAPGAGVRACSHCPRSAEQHRNVIFIHLLLERWAWTQYILIAPLLPRVPGCWQEGTYSTIAGKPPHLARYFPSKPRPPNPWPNLAFREGMNHIKSSAPSIRLDCCQRIAAGEVQADLAAAVLCWGSGILTSGMAWSHGFPIPNGGAVIPPSQRSVPL